MAVTGASEPSASGTPAACIGCEGVELRGPVGSEPRGVHAARPAPQRVEQRLHAGVARRGCASVASAVGAGHLDVLEPMTRSAERVGRRRSAAACSKPRGPTPVAASPITWKPAWTPARVHATTWSRICSVVRYWRPLVSGVCVRLRSGSAVREPIAPSTKRSPAAPRAPIARLARSRPPRARPSSRSTIGPWLAARPGASTAAKSSAPLMSGPPSSWNDADPERCRTVTRRALRGIAACVGGHGLEGGGAHGMVRFLAQPARCVVAGRGRLPPGTAASSAEDAAHGVHVDPRQVHDAAERRPVELLARRRPPFGPASTRPSRGRARLPPRCRARLRRDEVERLAERRGGTEVEAGRARARRRWCARGRRRRPA